MPVGPNPVKSDPASAAADEPRLPSDSASLIARLDGLFTGDHINASGGVHYSHKNFGRDSAVSMLFLLDMLRRTNRPEVRQETSHVIEQVIKSLIHWQGQKDPKIGDRWRKNAEEVGKIHHEAGPVEIDDLGLVSKWQEADDQKSDMLVYFGSVDATPLFIRLVCEYVDQLKHTDPSGHAAYKFLRESVLNFRGFHLTVLESLLEATRWVEHQLKLSDLGFIEYQRYPGQEEGIRNQVWKDSLTSYVHEDGSLINSDQPIAAVEVQGLAYDALTAVAEMFNRDLVLASSAHIDSRRVEQWRGLAQDLRRRIFERFWLADEKRFAQAIDRDPESKVPRPVSTPSSNELHLLNSRLFDDLDDQTKRSYLESLVRQAMGPDFLTDVGIRCRAKSRANLISFVDYHGSWAVWPWETHWIALGMRRQGLSRLADELDKRVLNSFAVAGDYLEFFLADPASEACYYRFNPLDWGKEDQAQGHPIMATNLPDTPQTWSLTAEINIQSILSTVLDHPPQSVWLEALEHEMLKGLKTVQLLTTGEQISRVREAAPVANIDRMGGKEADDRYYDLIGAAKNAMPAIPAGRQAFAS